MTLALVGLPPASPAGAQDALHLRVLAELRGFTDWLNRFAVDGYIGEVGWPDDGRGDSAEWNALAEAWFTDADAAGLWVHYWATGEWWGTKYPLAPYEDRDSTAGVDTPNTQAPVVEAHLGSGRGIVDAGGEFGEAPTTQRTSTFSNEHPGAYGREYHYDTAATFAFLASRGIGMVKIPFRWERLQPKPGGRLDPRELRRLRSVVDRAGAAGLDVVLDVHNFGAYYLERGGKGHRCAIGQRRCTVGDFADLWRRIAAAFKGSSDVVGYTLMTEPVAMKAIGSRSPAEAWRKASRAAVKTIRRTGERDAVLFVSGYHWSGTHDWTRWNPEPWIADPAGLVRYEAHHYWDRDHSGTYRHTYAEEVAVAEGSSRALDVTGSS
ncbi:MAG: glycoside hydrolase family 5 protein [Actinomycetota bacterium]